VETPKIGDFLLISAPLGNVEIMIYLSDIDALYRAYQLCWYVIEFC